MAGRTPADFATTLFQSIAYAEKKDCYPLGVKLDDTAGFTKADKAYIESLASECAQIAKLLK